MIKFITSAASVALLLSACDSKKSASSESSDEPAVPAAVVSEVDPQQLGFATRMPDSAELYVSMHNPGEILNALIQSDVTEMLFTLSEEADVPIDKKEKEEMMAKISEAIVKDAFLCIDQGAAWHVSAFGDFYQNLSAAQMKLGTQVLARVVNDTGEGKFSWEKESYKDLMEDFSKDGLKVMELFAERVDDDTNGLQLPSVYMGCTPPAGKIQEWLDHWKSGTKQPIEEYDYIESHSFEKYGTEFQGIKISMKGVLEQLKNDGEKPDQEEHDFTDMEKSWQEASLKIAEKFKELALVIVCGEVDGRLVIYIGPGADSLILVDDVTKSLASRAEFSKIGGVDEANLLAMFYASDDFLKSFQAWRGYEKTYNALAEAFQNERLPNSVKIVENLKSLAKLEHELETHEVDPFLMVCTIDDGFRIETMGGRRDRATNYTDPLQLAAATESMGDDLFMRLHWKGDRAWREMQLDYTEQLLGVVGQVIQGGYLAFIKENEDGAKWYDTSKRWYEELVEPEVVRALVRLPGFTTSVIRH